jgi:hypothetical protein
MSGKQMADVERELSEVGIKTIIHSEPLVVAVQHQRFAASDCKDTSSLSLTSV